MQKKSNSHIKKLIGAAVLVAGMAATAAMLVSFQPSTGNIMQVIIHKAEQRGHADHGWLKANHSFSFANYYDPDKMGFGTLRVLNDDSIAPGRGFGKHPHDNMEIVTIPLHGEVTHGDNFGNESAIIRAGDIQIMSAGSGIRHSEFNNNPQEPLKLFQIWVLPKERNIKPRYEQKSFNPAHRHNRWQTVVGPDHSGDSLWINQDAWFVMGDFDAGQKPVYEIKRKQNGVYLMVIEGSVKLNGQTLNRRDAAGIYATDKFDLEVSENSQLLAIDVPLSM